MQRMSKGALLAVREDAFMAGRRSVLTLSQIDWLKRAARHAVDPLALSPPQIGTRELGELFEALDALRAELSKGDEGACS